MSGGYTQLDDPLAGLPASGRQLVDAAKTILLEKGFPGLTVDAVVTAAGKNKAAVKYYFGSKDGLLAAVVDSLDYEECLQFAERIRDSRGDERLERYIEEQAGMSSDVPGFRMFFDLLPHVISHEHLRARVAKRYEWYYAMNIEWLGLADPMTDESRAQLTALAALMTAVVDGLAIQVALSPAGFDLGRAYGVLLTLLRCGLDEVVGKAAESRGSDGDR